MALDIGISTAKDSKGNIVAYLQGASFIQADRMKIKRPMYMYELWTSRGREPITWAHAISDKVAKELFNNKYHMKGLHIRRIRTSSRRVK